MRDNKKPTIRQVAQVAGVSPTTVSFVLNKNQWGLDRIPVETRQRVLNAIAELGYFPDQSARNLRRRNTDRICLAVNDLGIPYNNILAEELYRAASDLGYMTIIGLIGSAENEQKLLDQLLSGLADGVILISPSHLKETDLTRLAQIGYAVSISSNHLMPEGVDVVQNTEYEAASVALDYLYQKGHRRIGYIGRFSSEATPFFRHKAFLKFLEDNALPMDPELIRIDFGASREQAYHTVKAMLRAPHPPTAVYCGSDLAAISAIYAIRESGLRVPEDIAIIGSGNIPEGKIIQPALTTIGPEKFDFSTLIQFVFSRLRGEAPPEGRMHKIDWNLIIRDSA